MSFSRFISLWTHPDRPSDAISANELDCVESCLQTRLPKVYRGSVLHYGLPRPTIELLDAIADRELDVRDVSNFLDPSGIVTVTQGWRDLGLPEQFIAFATDCMGNLFCFPTAAETTEETPVFYFDHDERSVEMEAPSFTQWIDKFCAITPN